MNSKTPGIATLTAEDKANYAALATQNTERAHVLASALENLYFDKRSKPMQIAMYVDTTNGNKKDIASVWHLTAVLSMTSKLWSLDAGGQGAQYAAQYTNLYDVMQYHKGTADITTYNGTTKRTMYAVNRASKAGTASLAGIAAVYDDQMWIIRELIYTYQLTGDEAWLNEALSLTEACLDGWDTTLMSNGKEYGGICWGPGYSTKHTCSNAPLIEPLVELYEIFRDEGRENAEYYLEWAEKIYKWCREHFNTGNGVYGDLIGSSRTEEGVARSKQYVTTSQSNDMDRSAYAYNTGAMISGAAALYRATGTETYLTQAKNSAKAAYREFAIESNGMTQYTARSLGIYNSTVWFNLILLEGYLDLYPYDTNCKIYIDAFQTSLDYAYENYLSNDGLLPRDLLNGWDTKASSPSDANVKPDLNKDVMDQASYAEIYAQLAEFYNYVAAQ